MSEIFFFFKDTVGFKAVLRFLSKIGRGTLDEKLRGTIEWLRVCLFFFLFILCSCVWNLWSWWWWHDSIQWGSIIGFCMVNWVIWKLFSDARPPRIYSVVSNLMRRLTHLQWLLSIESSSFMQKNHLLTGGTGSWTKSWQSFRYVLMNEFLKIGIIHTTKTIGWSISSCKECSTKERHPPASTGQEQTNPFRDEVSQCTRIRAGAHHSINRIGV